MASAESEAARDGASQKLQRLTAGVKAASRKTRRAAPPRTRRTSRLMRHLSYRGPASRSLRSTSLRARSSSPTIPAAAEFPSTFQCP